MLAASPLLVVPKACDNADDGAHRVSKDGGAHKHAHGCQCPLPGSLSTLAQSGQRFKFTARFRDNTTGSGHSVISLCAANGDVPHGTGIASVEY